MFELLRRKLRHLYQDDRPRDVLGDPEEMESRMENLTEEIPRLDIDWENEL